MDFRVIPKYSDVFVELPDGTIQQLWATDTGVKGKAVDIYVDSHEQALVFGEEYCTVWFVPPEV